MTSETTAEHELVLVRDIDASRDKIFRAWTDPALLVKWFTPPPFKTVRADLDVRAGGANLIVMQGPDGQEFPNRGVYLEVIENEKIVFTDAFTCAWVPSQKPFMIGVILLEDLGNGRTRYTAKALHWNAEDKEAHEKMGFHEGWGIAADQLAALVATL